MSVIDKIFSAEALKQPWNIKPPANYPKRIVVFNLFFQQILKKRVFGSPLSISNKSCRPKFCKQTNCLLRDT